MNKLDEAIKEVEFAEKIYHEKFENSTPQAVLIILQAARAYSELLKHAPQIGALVEAGKKATQDEIIHGGGGQVYDAVWFNDLLRSSCCGGRADFYDRNDGEFAASAFNTRSTLKAIHDNLTKFEKDTPDE